MKSYLLIFLVLANILSLFSLHNTVIITSSVESSDYSQDLKGVNVLIFAANHVGNSYFVLKEQMESLGATVTTIGLADIHTSCGNVETPVSINTNTTISNFDRETIKDYKALIIPSGGYWESMLMQDNLFEFIEFSYENNLLIASICIGMVILSETSIIDGVSMVAHGTAIPYLTDAGAEIEYGSVVISDENIISGGAGGGFTGGRYLGAPNEELCHTIARRILDYSYLSNLKIKREVNNISLDLTVNSYDNTRNQDMNISRIYAKV